MRASEAIHVTGWHEMPHAMAACCKVFLQMRVTWPSGRQTSEMLASAGMVSAIEQAAGRNVLAAREQNMRASLLCEAERLERGKWLVRRRKGRPKPRAIASVEWVA